MSLTEKENKLFYLSATHLYVIKASQGPVCMYHSVINMYMYMYTQIRVKYNKQIGTLIKTSPLYI